jgi:hypothetical protein
MLRLNRTNSQNQSSSTSQQTRNNQMRTVNEKKYGVYSNALRSLIIQNNFVLTRKQLSDAYIAISRNIVGDPIMENFVSLSVNSFVNRHKGKRIAYVPTQSGRQTVLLSFNKADILRFM